MSTFQNIGGKVLIEIKEVKVEEFDDIKNQLIELQYQNTCMHFPNKKIDIEKQTKPTVNSIKEYMKDEKAFLFIAMEKNEVLGFLWCYPRVFFDEDRIFINSLIVKERYRNQHIGKRLMQEVEKKAEKLNCDSIYVSTASFNEKALKFYNRQGYQKERIQLVKKVGK